MHKDNIILSIIIPIYNANDTLEKCLDSLTKIANNKIEILLIDDGSVDCSASICDQFSKSDKRFKYINKKNGGVSSARNVGLQEASGEYVSFVDSDDYVDSSKINKIVKILNKSAEILIFNYSRNTVLSDITDVKIEINDRQWLLDNLKKSEFANDFGYVWNKIYKRKIIEDNNILFEENISEREDFLFNIDYFKHINEIVLSSDYVYCYVQYEQSLSKRKSDVKILGNFISLLEQKLEGNYINKSIKLENSILELIADYIIKNIFKCCDKYRDIKYEFNQLLVYEEYIKKSKTDITYLKIVKKCFEKKNIFNFYLYYKLSELKKKIKIQNL